MECETLMKYRELSDPKKHLSDSDFFCRKYTVKYWKARMLNAPPLELTQLYDANKCIKVDLHT